MFKLLSKHFDKRVFMAMGAFLLGAIGLTVMVFVILYVQHLITGQSVDYLFNH